MSPINVLHVGVLNNRAPFTDPLKFAVRYECLQDLQDDLEWKVTYVGSAESDSYDQELESVLVGPVVVGTYEFAMEASAPDPSKIPPEDIVGITVVLVTCSYRSQEFIRVGYYVRVEYEDEPLRENPPEVPKVDRLLRHVLDDQPRVTRFPVAFDGADAADVSMEAA